METDFYILCSAQCETELEVIIEVFVGMFYTLIILKIIFTPGPEDIFIAFSPFQFSLLF